MIMAILIHMGTGTAIHMGTAILIHTGIPIPIQRSSVLSRSLKNYLPTGLSTMKATGIHISHGLNVGRKQVLTIQHYALKKPGICLNRSPGSLRKH